MTTIDIEKTLLCHLLACDVPESAIRIVRAENSDIVTVSVTGQYMTLLDPLQAVTPKRASTLK